jgi:hypothetical protein
MKSMRNGKIFSFWPNIITNNRIDDKKHSRGYNGAFCYHYLIESVYVAAIIAKSTMVLFCTTGSFYFQKLTDTSRFFLKGQYGKDPDFLQLSEYLKLH